MIAPKVEHLFGDEEIRELIKAVGGLDAINRQRVKLVDMIKLLAILGDYGDELEAQRLRRKA